MLDLKFKKAEQYGDTLGIFLSFYFDKIECNRTTVETIINDGITFSISKDSVIAFIVEDHLIGAWDARDSTRRFVKPLQPDVIKYIQNNKDGINSWFLNEAIKRGVIVDANNPHHYIPINKKGS
jgi:hypothetical protein